MLDPEGIPLPLMHSDDVYLALFGTPSMERFRKICLLFALPYPFGLSFFDDDIGFAITNALYAPRDHAAFQDSWKNTWVKFGPEEYHGRAAWPWVLFALLNGIRNQIMRGIAPDGQLENGLTSDDLDLFQFLLEKSKVSLKKLGPLATSEVYKFGPAQTEGSTWQAEPMGISTPIQLWSASPANLLIDEALARINRFRQR